MTIGVLGLDIYLQKGNSLKHKRMILKSLKDRLRSNFNVSVAEVDAHDKWQRSTLAIACVGQDKCYVNSLLARTQNFIQGFNQIVILDSQMELF